MTTSDPLQPGSTEPAGSTEPSLADRIEELAARVEREAAGATASESDTGSPPATPASAPAASPGGSETLGALLSEMSADVAEFRGVLEARMAVLEDSLAGVADRLEALARDGASTTGERLSALATDVRGLDARLTDICAPTDVEPTGSRAAGQDALADAVTDALNDLADAVGESLSALGANVTGALAETQALIVSGAGAQPGLAAAGDELAAGVRPDAAAGPTLAALLDQAVSDLRAGQGEDLQAMRADFAEAVGASLSVLGVSVTGALEETRALIASGTAAVSDVRAGQGEDLMALRADLADAVGEAMSALGASLTDALEETRALIASGTAAVSDARAGQGEDLMALRADLADALDEVLDRVTLQAQDTSERLVAVAASSAAEHGELVLRAQDAARAAAAEAEVLLSEVTRNGGVLASVLADMQSQRVLSVSLVDETKTAVARVDDTLGAVATSLVRYLGERDRLIELERAQLLREVFAELATTMTPADRRRLASRISDALSRRHDARDAERWREQSPAVVAPHPVDHPDVEELGALLDRHSNPPPADEPGDTVPPVSQAAAPPGGPAATTIRPGSRPMPPTRPTPSPAGTGAAAGSRPAKPSKAAKANKATNSAKATKATLAKPAGQPTAAAPASPPRAP